MRALEGLLTCTRCDLAATRTRVVPGSGPERCVLMVIGEAPGRDEDEGGEPFIGRSGQLLFRLIGEEVGLQRGQCFVTNVVKCRPPGNRVPTPHEIATCRPWLEAQLAVVTPRAVLALGATAGRAVFDVRESMARAHGRVRHLGDVPGLVTYHPAAALRGGPSVVTLLRQDLSVVRALVEAA